MFVFYEGITEVNGSFQTTALFIFKRSKLRYFRVLRSESSLSFYVTFFTTGLRDQGKKAIETNLTIFPVFVCVFVRVCNFARQLIYFLTFQMTRVLKQFQMCFWSVSLGIIVL